MPKGVIDGDRWIVERIAYLTDLLGDDLSGEQRHLIEAEIERLRRERGYHLGGFKVRWFPSRWFGRPKRRKDRGKH